MQALYEIESIRLSDDLLGQNITDDIMEKAERWLAYFAATLDVKVDEIVPSFVVAELITAYAMREVCVKKSFGVGGLRYGQVRLKARMRALIILVKN